MCPYCDTILVPETCTVRTISKRKIKKYSKRYHIIQNNHKKSHYLVRCHDYSQLMYTYINEMCYTFRKSIVRSANILT